VSASAHICANATDKEAVFTLKLEPGLRRAFIATARANDRIPLIDPRPYRRLELRIDLR
jgi:hypothetical protein